MPADRPITVLIVDDERTFGEALELALGHEKDLLVVDVTTSGAEGVASAAEHQPDVVIMDVTMPGMSGIEATRRIKETEPDAHILVLSGHDDEHLLARAMQAGASGVLRKTEAVAELARSVRQAHRGEAINEPEEVERALRRLRHRRAQDAGSAERLSRLTPRELEILQLMAEGRSPEAISAALGVTPATLRTHTQNLITRLGVHSKMEALVLAIRHGTVTTVDVTDTDTDTDTETDTDTDTETETDITADTDTETAVTN
jgi:DNA-binding NarL/FixJ family response regulator